MATYTENYNLKMPSGQDAPDVEDFNTNAEIIDTVLKAQSDNTADEYSPDETYTAGRLVIQNNALWKAKQDISVAEPWTPDHWDPTTLAAELSAVNSSMVVQTPGNSIVIETMSIGLGISNNRIYIAVQYPFLINGDYDIAINELGITNVIGGASGAGSASVVKQSNSGCQLAYDGEDVVFNQSYFCSQVKLTITFKGHNTSI